MGRRAGAETGVSKALETDGMARGSRAGRQGSSVDKALHPARRPALTAFRFPRGAVPASAGRGAWSGWGPERRKCLGPGWSLGRGRGGGLARAPRGALEVGRLQVAHISDMRHPSGPRERHPRSQAGQTKEGLLGPKRPRSEGEIVGPVAAQAGSPRIGRG